MISGTVQNDVSVTNDNPPPYEPTSEVVSTQPKRAAPPRPPAPARPPAPVFAQGREIAVVESPHCGTYKKAYAVWGIGTAIGFVASFSCGIPLCVTEGGAIGTGVAAGVTTCCSTIAGCAAVKTAHKINEQKGFDTTVTGGVVDFTDIARETTRDVARAVSARVTI